MPITILECAIARGAKPNANGTISPEAINTAGFHFIGGCIDCHATLAAYNAYPTQGSFWACADCIDTNGFLTMEKFNEWAAAQSERDAKFDEFCNGVRPRLTKEIA